ncbi:uncharacterized protein RAG0_12362 [Rhynchosporium agropyri]|uniref:Uncharacterized protein n=1 Tax=Rhynchosporium agropyri TaxID=914238 RepID=A0A1E1L8L1_9HELO|nr:uncharacterized protein RAG0_12362 [Rhynchosporium agropyri]
MPQPSENRYLTSRSLVMLLRYRCAKQDNSYASLPNVKIISTCSSY